jgi:hypothetical protein
MPELVAALEGKGGNDLFHRPVFDHRVDYFSGNLHCRHCDCFQDELGDTRCPPAAALLCHAYCAADTKTTFDNSEPRTNYYLIETQNFVWNTKSYDLVVRHGRQRSQASPNTRLASTANTVAKSASSFAQASPRPKQASPASSVSSQTGLHLCASSAS